MEKGVWSGRKRAEEEEEEEVEEKRMKWSRSERRRLSNKAGVGGGVCQQPHLFDQRSLLLLSHLVAAGQVAVVLRLHGLHVDLQTQLGVLRGLQLVLQLLQLHAHLLKLLVLAALRLLQLMDLEGREGADWGQAWEDPRGIERWDAGDQR